MFFFVPGADAKCFQVILSYSKKGAGADFSKFRHRTFETGWSQLERKSLRVILCEEILTLLDSLLSDQFKEFCSKPIDYAGSCGAQRSVLLGQLAVTERNSYEAMAQTSRLCV
jgi:hypothetical protein